MQFGIFSFVDYLEDAVTGKKITAQQRIKNLIEEIKLADELGLDVYGIGEHHRHEYLASSPAVLLAAAASVTKKIILTSAVTVLSSDDPVRVFQQFAELDLVSNGRAEITAGRGSFIESFPLFGYKLSDYNELFEEKLELLLKIRNSEKVIWQGNLRPDINNLGIYPRPVQNLLPVWIAAGGSPESMVRAGNLGLPLALAIIGGKPKFFQPLIEIYRQSLKESGFDPNKIPVSINSHGFIAESSQKAKDEYYPYYEKTMNIIGKERGWPPSNRIRFEKECEIEGALLVGSPQDIVDKILYEHKLFDFDRFMLQISVSTLPHEKMLKAIDLFATKVIPEVKKRLSIARK